MQYVQRMKHRQAAGQTPLRRSFHLHDMGRREFKSGIIERSLEQFAKQHNIIELARPMMREFWYVGPQWFKASACSFVIQEIMCKRSYRLADPCRLKPDIDKGCVDADSWWWLSQKGVNPTIYPGPTWIITATKQAAQAFAEVILEEIKSAA